MSTPRHGSRLTVLSQAGVLSAVSEMLDAQTLQTVISHVDEFCRSIPMCVVERTLRELFGCRWKHYYDSYVSHTLLEKNADSDIHPWGLGYDFHFPQEPCMINGHVVLAALQTLNSIAQRCQDYNYSFIPGEPSECGINRVSFLENGRLIWIQYYPKSYDYTSDGDYDFFNLEDDSPQAQARRDGQVLLRDDEPALAMLVHFGAQEAQPKKIRGFQHELWDVGAQPHPRCLWSSMWEAIFPTSTINVCNRVVPLTTFFLELFDGFLLPSMKGFGINFNQDIINTRLDTFGVGCFMHNQSPNPLRFVKCSSTFAVVDLLHLEQMQFRGVKKLEWPRLSYDSNYLGAIARINVQHGEVVSYLAIWHVALPRPYLIWKKGIKLLCCSCYWFIDRDWLIAICRGHGTRAYHLGLPSPRAIELTRFVPYSVKGAIVLKFCGVNSDILACDLPATRSFSFIKLSEYKKGKWKAQPLSIPLDSRTLSIPLNSRPLTESHTASRGCNVSSYIHKIGTRYCLGTMGDLFDLGKADVSRDPTDDSGIILEPINPKPLRIVAIWEAPEGEQAITVCYDDRKTVPVLIFWLFTALGQHRQLTTSGISIRYQDVKLVVFSPDGDKVFVCPHNDQIGGWLVIIKSTYGKMQPEVCVKSVPRLSFSAKTMPTNQRPIHACEVRFPFFLSKDTVAIVRNNCKGKGLVQVGAQTIPSYNLVDSKIVLVRIDEATLELECSDIGVPVQHGPEARRLYSRRWIDVLLEKTRDLAYCQSITCVGLRTALSPGHRFLLYQGERDSRLQVLPQVELCDLCSPRRTLPKDFRRSWYAFFYALKLRRDYLRVSKYADCIKAVNST